MAAVLVALLIALLYFTNLTALAQDTKNSQVISTSGKPANLSDTNFKPNPAPKKPTPTDLKDHDVDPAKVRALLEKRKSPLAPYSDLISKSEFSATIIGICTIEQYGCTRAPAWNFWGIKGAGPCGSTHTDHGDFRAYCSAEQGIAGIDSYLTDAYIGDALHKPRTTVESINGWYCQSECVNWYSTVLNTKKEIESVE